MRKNQIVTAIAGFVTVAVVMASNIRPAYAAMVQPVDPYAGQAQTYTFTTTAQNPNSGFPVYLYLGDDPYLGTVCEYLRTNVAPMYAQGDVAIPAPVILAEDTSDQNDIRIYGNFWTYWYNANEETGYFDTVSGGGMPGCIHLRNTGNGYVVTAVEKTEDGAGYNDSLIRICSGHPGLYNSFCSADMEGKRVRAKMESLRMYMSDYDLHFNGYQDPGWSPVNIWS